MRCVSQTEVDGKSNERWENKDFLSSHGQSLGDRLQVSTTQT